MQFIIVTVITIVHTIIAFTGKSQPNAVDGGRWHYLMLHSWWSCFMHVWRVPLFIVLNR